MKAPNVWLLKDGEPLPHEDKGQSLRTGNLAKALLGLGCTVTWFASTFDHGQKRQRSSKTEVIDVADHYQIVLLKGPGYQKNASLGRVFHQFETGRQFLRIAPKMERPDLIVSAYPTPELNFAASNFAMRRRVPYVVDVRDPWPDLFPQKPHLIPLKAWYKKLLKRSLRRACGIVSMSDKMLDWALLHAGREKTEADAVFHLGAQRSLSPEPRIQEWRPSAEEPLVCVYYAMFGKLHRGDVILKAARILSEQKDKRIRFVFVGDGELRALWEQEVRDLDSVRFLGWMGKEDAALALRQAQVGIIAIGPEVADVWFGNKFFEYLEAGLALVNNTTSELQGLIQSKKLGLQFNGVSAEHLAQQLCFLADRPEMLAEMRRNGWQLFQSEFESGSVYGRYARHVLRLAGVDLQQAQAMNNTLQAVARSA